MSNLHVLQQSRYILQFMEKNGLWQKCQYVNVYINKNAGIEVAITRRPLPQRPRNYIFFMPKREFF